MKVKTSELSGAALDWAVAKCEGRRVEFNHQYTEETKFNGWWQLGPNHWQPLNNYSTNWSQGGPIIDREKITVVCAEGDYNPSKAGTSECYDTYWVATRGKLSASTVYGPQGDNWGECFQIDADAVQGPTPLIAAIRCYVASKLGDKVDIPDELLK